MCEGLKVRGAAFAASFGRTSSADLIFFLVRRGHYFFRSLQYPLVPRLAPHRPSSLHTALLTPNVTRLFTVEPSVAPIAWKSSLRQSSQFRYGRPLPGSSPPISFPSISRFGRRQAGCLAMAPAQRSRRCRMVASTLWHPVFLRA